jgi:hypothetical protein
MNNEFYRSSCPRSICLSFAFAVFELLQSSERSEISNWTSPNSEWNIRWIARERDKNNFSTIVNSSNSNEPS